MSLLTEHPISPLLDRQTPAAHAPRASTDVIDVDLLDDDDDEPIMVHSTTRCNNHNRNGHDVDIIDLTAEDDNQPSTSSGQRRSGVAHAHGRRLFSPPAPIQAPEIVPPVPPIPRYAQQNWPRMRIDDPTAGVVRAEPYAFEMNFRASPPRRVIRPPPTLPPRPPSPPMRMHVHRPANIGLGGALVSANSRANGRNPAYWDYLTRLVDSVRPIGVGRGGARDRRTMTLFTPMDLEDRQPPDPDYKLSYTHPATEESGFTHDFAPQAEAAPIVIDLVDSDGKEKEPEEPPVPTLACAHCERPLELAGGSAQDGIEAQANRIWALRCGHVIDGRCLDKLSIPLPVLGAETKGSKRKGKGRAKPTVAPLPPRPEDVNWSYADYLPGPIRSRLRSNAGSISHPAEILTATPMAGIGQSSSKPAPKRRKPAKRRKVQEEHKWKCPVASCQKEHTSVKVDGVWSPETERGEGAIGLFV